MPSKKPDKSRAFRLIWVAFSRLAIHITSSMDYFGFSFKAVKTSRALLKDFQYCLEYPQSQITNGNMEITPYAR